MEEGGEPCGMIDCPLSLHTINSFNNTYNCVRSLEVGVEDSMYCQFEEEKEFVEYYDSTKNPH
jgi:hypothetical protein